MNKKQHLIVTRSFLFSFSVIAIVFSLLNDTYFRNHSFADGIVFGTHLSNLGVLIWSMFGMVSLLWKNDKYEKIINTGYVKFTVTTFIIVTSTVFVSVALVPVVVLSLFEAKPGLHGISAGELALGTIFTTLLLHLVVPALMTIEFFTNTKSSASHSKTSNHDKSMRLAIIPPMYFTFVLLMTSYGTLPPYPIFEFTSPPATGILSTLTWQWLSFIAAGFIGAGFVIVARILLRYESAGKRRYGNEKDFK